MDWIYAVDKVAFFYNKKHYLCDFNSLKHSKMILIDDVLVSDDVVEQKFVCNLKACKGACCVAGDYGAPLEDDEVLILKEIYPKIKPFLTAEGIAEIEKQGTHAYFEGDMNAIGTPLIAGAACVYVAYDADGTAKCGIEQAHKAGVVEWKKPISCHLYPIRISKTASFTVLNYDEWDICKAACTFGKRLQVPVYEFLKEPLIRRFGADFYEALDATVKKDNV
jgi:hypothetical protein